MVENLPANARDKRCGSIPGSGVLHHAFSLFGWTVSQTHGTMYWIWCCLAKLCPLLFNPMDSSMPGFSVLHYLPEFVQIHVHWVGDAIQPSHPLSPSSPPALNLSWLHGLFQWVGSLHQVVKVLELQTQHQSFQQIFRNHSIFNWFLLGLTGLILQSKELSRVFSSTTVWKHQFFSTQLSLWSNSHISMRLLEKP